MVYGELKGWGKGQFVPVVDKEFIYYGGFQNWLEDEGVSIYYANRSCGVTALANALFYMSTTNSKLSVLYPYDSYTKDNFSKYQKTLYDIAKPKTWGVPTVQSLVKVCQKYARSKGVVLTPITYDDEWKEEKLAQFISNALNNNKPILLVTWDSIIKGLKFHWVVVTRIYGELGNIKIVTSNWGELRMYSFTEWVNENSLYKRVLYFDY